MEFDQLTDERLQRVIDEAEPSMIRCSKLNHRPDPDALYFDVRAMARELLGRRKSEDARLRESGQGVDTVAGRPIEYLSPEDLARDRDRWILDFFSTKRAKRLEGCRCLQCRIHDNWWNRDAPAPEKASPEPSPKEDAKPSCTTCGCPMGEPHRSMLCIEIGKSRGVH